MANSNDSHLHPEGIDAILNAQNIIPEQRLEKKLNGKPLFFSVVGAHSYGFPSVNSDMDLRGVYMAPSKRFLGLRKTVSEPSLTYITDDLMVDVCVEEVGKFLQLVAGSNGDRFEWLDNGLVAQGSPELGDLQAAVNEFGISKKLGNYYQNFARDIWVGKTNLQGIRRDLHTLRTYMTGINVLETGEIQTHIVDLSRKFGCPIVEELVELKKSDEKGSAKGYDRKAVEKKVAEFDQYIASARKNSALRDSPDRKMLNEYLVGLRARYL
jgi:uncharacterized protein